MRSTFCITLAGAPHLATIDANKIMASEARFDHEPNPCLYASWVIGDTNGALALGWGRGRSVWDDAANSGLLKHLLEGVAVPPEDYYDMETVHLGSKRRPFRISGAWMVPAIHLPSELLIRVAIARETNEDV
jgi:hypothetical protein